MANLAVKKLVKAINPDCVKKQPRGFRARFERSMIGLEGKEVSRSQENRILQYIKFITGGFTTVVMNEFDFYYVTDLIIKFVKATDDKDKDQIRNILRTFTTVPVFAKGGSKFTAEEPVNYSKCGRLKLGEDHGDQDSWGRKHNLHKYLPFNGGEGEYARTRRYKKTIERARNIYTPR